MISRQTKVETVDVHIIMIKRKTQRTGNDDHGNPCVPLVVSIETLKPADTTLHYTTLH